jgi:hypothetical protein
MKGAVAGRVVAGALLLCALVATPAVADAPGRRETRLTTIFALTHFVEWPGTASPDPSRLIVCVVGFGNAARTRQNQSSDIAHLTPMSVEGDPRHCHVLIVPERVEGSAERLLARARFAPVLTVGESERFTSIGGMVRLYRQNGRVRVDNDLTAAERAGLRFSSRLLSMARIVSSQDAGITAPAPEQD